MAKAKVFEQRDGGTERDLGTHVWIFCPGCKGYHSLRIRMPAQPTQEETNDLRNNKHGMWSFNGDVEKPTFKPSLLVSPQFQDARCHSFITDGKIQFLSDCYHDLKNQTVELPEIDL